MKYLVLVCLLHIIFFPNSFGQNDERDKYNGCTFGFIAERVSVTKSGSDSQNHLFNKILLIGVDSDSAFLHSYLFSNEDSIVLRKLANALIKKGYTLTRLEYVGKTFILDVEKIEKHSIKTLINREHELAALCKKFKINTYDAWRINNPNKNKPVVCIDKVVNIIRSKKNEELFEYAKVINDFVFYIYAAVAFDSCIHRGIKLDSSHFYLANCLVVSRETEQQIFHYEKTIELNPLFFEAYIKLGWVYYNDETYDKSVMYFNKITVLNPKNSEGFCGLAYAQYKLNKLEDSKINCETALQLDPNNENALTLKKMLKGK